MLKSGLCDYSDAYILVSGNITIHWEGADDNSKRWLNERNKAVISKNSPPFTDTISEINNTQTDNAKNLDVGIPMYNLFEYSDNHSRTSESLW